MLHGAYGITGHRAYRPILRLLMDLYHLRRNLVYKISNLKVSQLVKFGLAALLCHGLAIDWTGLASIALDGGGAGAYLRRSWWSASGKVSSRPTPSSSYDKCVSRLALFDGCKE